MVRRVIGGTGGRGDSFGSRLGVCWGGLEGVVVVVVVEEVGCEGRGIVLAMVVVFVALE